MTKVYMHLEVLVPTNAGNVDDLTPENWQQSITDDEPMKVMVHGAVEVPEDLEDAVEGLAGVLAALIMADATTEDELLANIPDDQIPHA